MKRLLNQNAFFYEPGIYRVVPIVNNSACFFSTPAIRLFSSSIFSLSIFGPTKTGFYPIQKKAAING
ncbi:MAG: hypothetical protein IPK90_11280 [Chitinophagaceae bacterium]|nr:hypothetical protein [Chitinophagaceae bacterium]